MEINIIAFGQIAEITGQSTWTMQSVADSDILQARLKEAFPAISNIAYRIAVDKKMITEKTLLHPNATIALLPPFSGG